MRGGNANRRWVCKPGSTANSIVLKRLIPFAAATIRNVAIGMPREALLDGARNPA
jgi:hypothetical protein